MKLIDLWEIRHPVSEHPDGYPLSVNPNHIVSLSKVNASSGNTFVCLTSGLMFEVTESIKTIQARIGATNES